MQLQMSDDLANKLFGEFSHLYRGHTKPREESLMHWGFECGDGWYPLLRNLSHALSTYQGRNPELNLEVTQVKSKFGLLRFGLSGGDEFAQSMIDQAAKRAKSTCEITGRPGRLCMHRTKRLPPVVLSHEKAIELDYVFVTTPKERDFLL